MNKYDLSIIIPCFNEQNNIIQLVTRLKHAFRLPVREKIEIILVNDGSTDDTKLVINSLAARDGIVGIHHLKNKGIEEAWRTGLENARGKHVCLMDADLQNLPEDVPRLYDRVAYADIVQGYRSLKGRKRDLRFLLSRGLNLILNTLFFMDSKDNKSGFIITSRSILWNILSHRFRYRHFQSFIMVSAHSQGYSIEEVETVFAPRWAGKSYMKDFPTKIIMYILLDMVKAILEFRILSPFSKKQKQL